MLHPSIHHIFINIISDFVPRVNVGYIPSRKASIENTRCSPWPDSEPEVTAHVMWILHNIPSSILWNSAVLIFVCKTRPLLSQNPKSRLKFFSISSRYLLLIGLEWSPQLPLWPMAKTLIIFLRDSWLGSVSANISLPLSARSAGHDAWYQGCGCAAWRSKRVPRSTRPGCPSVVKGCVSPT